MSESDNITRCPYCQTSFKVVDVQLYAANGAVRCGSCLQVFQARDYFVVAEADCLIEAATETVALSDQEAALNSDDTCGLQGFVEVPAVLLVPAESEVPDTVANLSETAWREPIYDPGLTILPVIDKVEIQISPEIEASPIDYQIVPEVDVSEGLNAASAAAASWHNAMDLPQELPAVDVSDLKSTVAESAAVDDEAEDSVPWGDEMDLAKLDLAGLDMAREDPQDIIGELLAPRQKSWPWMIAGLALIATLGGQFAWYAKDLLAQDATARPYYKLACSYLGCGLPLYLNRRAIEATDLVVRSQQSNPPVLIVDAIIKNSGAFRQVFPDLELQFTNAENQIVASRRFSPAEYLAGEMTGLGYFPAYTEVRLSLEIVDPGDDALGYSLAIEPDS